MVIITGFSFFCTLKLKIYSSDGGKNSGSVEGFLLEEGTINRKTCWCIRGEKKQLLISYDFLKFNNCFVTY